MYFNRADLQAYLTA